MVTASLYREKLAYFNLSINNKIKEPKRLRKTLKATLNPDKRAKDFPSHFSDQNLINLRFLSGPGYQTDNLSTMMFFNLIGMEEFSLLQL